MTTNNFKDILQFFIRAAEPESKINFHRELSFNLIFILDGNGTHYMQPNNRPYKKGDIFIVAPHEETHYLKAVEPTSLFIIRFSSLFISSEKENNKLKTDLVQLLQYANQTPDYIFQLRNDAYFIKQLLRGLLAEVQNKEPSYGLEYISSLFYTILVMVGEKIKISLPKDINTRIDQKTVDMLHYIHQNIFSPEKLTTQELSRRFFISQAYVGKYFKNNTSHSLHQYIMIYKIKIIENRLINSNMRISEIADEFGFTDKSYLNKFFVKHNGISPLAYRKNNRNLFGNFDHKKAYA